MPRARAPLGGALQPLDELSRVDFDRIADLIGSEAGIRLQSNKRAMVEARLKRRMKDLGMRSFAQYTQRLFSHVDHHAELPYLINALTTNKTDFFREKQHYDLLRSSLVPELLARRAKAHMPLLKVWSAACSYGAEAYSAAMVLADMAEKRRDFRFMILGTDISTDMVAEARRGVFSASQISPVPENLQDKYCMWSRRADPPMVRIVPELRRLARFQYLNLMDRQYPVDTDVDIIFLRNVLIYFDKADQAKVIDRLVSHLRPGGYLLLGHSESISGATDAVRQIAPASFQRI